MEGGEVILILYILTALAYYGLGHAQGSAREKQRSRQIEEWERRR